VIGSAFAADDLVSKAGEGDLSASTKLSDTRDPALSALVDEWTSSVSFADCVALLHSALAETNGAG
jgi:hypothetical protein